MSLFHGGSCLQCYCASQVECREQVAQGVIKSSQTQEITFRLLPCRLICLYSEMISCEFFWLVGFLILVFVVVAFLFCFVFYLLIQVRFTLQFIFGESFVSLIFLLCSGPLIEIVLHSCFLQSISL